MFPFPSVLIPGDLMIGAPKMSRDRSRGASLTRDGFIDFIVDIVQLFVDIVRDLQNLGVSDPGLFLCPLVQPL